MSIAWNERPEAALERWFGFSAFRAGQRRIVEAMLAGRDVLAVLPTGAGKSVCFQLPALMTTGLTLVVSPLVSLMQDQVASLRRRSLPAAYIDSSTSAAERRRIATRIRRGELSLLYAAPERLAASGFRMLTRSAGLTRIVIDEAHCISEWGHDFRPEYRCIGEFALAVGRPPLAAFTATATARTREDIRRCLRLREPFSLTASVNRPNLRWQVCRAARRGLALDVAAHAARSTLRADPQAAAIVYAPTRAATIRVAEALLRLGVEASPYHAGLSAGIRRAVQQSFTSGQLRAVTATSAFGMGIDHPHVRLVCHVGSPPALEAYVQEAGRAGRDGRSADCLLLVTPEDRSVHATLIRRQWPAWSSIRSAWDSVGAAAGTLPDPPLAPAEDREAANRILLQLGYLRVGRGGALVRVRSPARVPVSAHVRWGRRRARQRLAAMLRYARTGGCRRAAIARYFGERPPPCGGCDRCDAAGQR